MLVLCMRAVGGGRAARAAASTWCWLTSCGALAPAGGGPGADAGAVHARRWRWPRRARRGVNLVLAD